MYVCVSLCVFDRESMICVYVVKSVCVFCVKIECVWGFCVKRDSVCECYFATLSLAVYCFLVSSFRECLAKK